MKQALVTGGSGGIGAAICRRLAADGHHVLIHAHSNIRVAETLAAELNAEGYSAQPVEFDITNHEAVLTALNPLTEQAPIQILVNNAGIHDDAAFPGMAAQQWQRVFDVSVNGFYHVTHTLMMPMIRTRWGRIVNLSSIAAISGNRGQVNYAAAKGAINSATRSLALELASRGITVNAVAPGIIDTAMSRAAFDADAIARLVPMKRAGTPAEVADLIGFLVSPQAAYITGQIISVNGGMI
ncbi:MAG TPA: 3-oxoacyl-ACP reductase FabG [Burkholderiales bacterium]|nr:3-oxoacyl-ACP reductase FabG [Burkholderiales bacterium]